MVRTVASILLVVALVAGLSWVSARLWGGGEEAPPDLPDDWTWREDMTARRFAEANGIAPDVVAEAVGGRARLDEPIGDLAGDRGALIDRVRAAAALHAERGSKNWLKIPLKFALWLIALGAAFVLMRRRRVTRRLRLAMLLISVAVFGVALGADPNPMGTVKDAVALFGRAGTIFPPRLIALGVFVVLVIVANKFICTWGCQFGALQDALFRLNRDASDRRGVMPQYKVPFVVTNTVRVLFFAAFTAVALLWAFDLIAPIDPFKIFNPVALGAAGAAAVGGLLAASVFVWRPWCHFFCPFGLVGWVAEKLGIHKIQVDYDACIACGACEKACPSTVMGAILRRDRRTIPDCFACGTCIETCPVDAIYFRAGRRDRPPAGKFDGDDGRQARGDDGDRAAGQER